MISIKSYKGIYKVINFDFNNFLKKNFTQECIFILDKKLISLYPNLKKFIKNKNKLIITANERSKDFSMITRYLTKFSEKKVNKKFKIYAIGGGVVQDISCFIASIYFRGIKWYFIPTTLESQGDSCIGSKSSINLNGKKNQIGTFYPPSEIFLDTKFLGTLDNNLFWSGIGEMLHYFVFDRKDFNYYKLNFIKSKKNISILKKIILKSLKIKKKFIEIDEFDKGKRKLLNYGHTFAHAIEAYTNYKIPHGISVAHGINIANYISYKKKFISLKDYLEINSITKIITQNFPLKRINETKFLKIIKSDKKASSNSINLILLKKKKIFLHNQNFNSEFRNILRSYFKNNG